MHWIYGVHPVLAHVSSGLIENLYLQEGADKGNRLEPLLALAQLKRDSY